MMPTEPKRTAPRMRQVVHLTEEGLSGEAIARQLGIAVGTVYAYRDRARNEMTSREMSDREAEVVALMREGLSKAEIAAKLRISDRTVDSHRYNLIRRFGATNSFHLIAIIDDKTIEALRGEIADLQRQIDKLHTSAETR